MTRFFFVSGCILAALAVIAGAFGAHALEGRLTPDRLATFETAARYQMYHALALLACAAAVERFAAGTASAAGWLILAGICVFSGTLYALSFGAPRILGAITPIGGLALITGWLLLGLSALRN